MSNCIISGLKTNNKYKNQPIHPDVIDLAKDLVVSDGITMSQAFQKLSYMLVNDIKVRLDKGEQPSE